MATTEITVEKQISEVDEALLFSTEIHHTLSHGDNLRRNLKTIDALLDRRIELMRKQSKKLILEPD